MNFHRPGSVPYGADGQYIRELSDSAGTDWRSVSINTIIWLITHGWTSTFLPSLDVSVEEFGLALLPGPTGVESQEGMSILGRGGCKVTLNLDTIVTGGLEQQSELIQAKPSKLVFDQDLIDELSSGVDDLVAVPDGQMLKNRIRP